MLAFADAQRKEDAAAELISTLGEQQAHLGCDPAIVAVEYEIGALVERRGAVRQALEHMPKRETELQQRTIAIASLLTELRMEPTSDIPTLLAQLQARAHILWVREQARECDRLLLAAKAARAQSEEYAAQESLSNDQAKESKQAPRFVCREVGGDYCTDSSSAGRKLRAAGRARQRANRELTKELATLHDWSRGLDALAALQVPSDGLIEQHQSRMHQTQSLVRELETEQRQREESIAQNELKRQRLVGSDKAVTYESLLQVRSVRNDAWNEARDHLFKKTVLTNLETTTFNYEGAVGSADEVADNRYSSSAASSRAEALDDLDIDAILSDAEGFNSETGESREAQIAEKLGEIDAEHSRIATELGVAQEAFRLIDAPGSGAVTAAADAELARADMAREAEAYLFKKSQSIILKWLIERQHQTGQSPLLLRASELFKRLTVGRYSGLMVDSDGPGSRLLGLAKDGNTTVPLEPMSDGTKGQLYLSLRIAAMEQSISNGVAMPFLADDLFINFDDDRAWVGLEILGELSRITGAFLHSP